MSSAFPAPDPARTAPVRRVLILCTHNSARSQMAEAWTRHLAQQAGVALEVHSAGSEATLVKPGALAVMAEVGLSLEAHRSKTMEELPDPWNFGYVITVCDSADARCPVYPARTVRRHYPFLDPSGGPLEGWRAVRDAMRPVFAAFVQAVANGEEAPPSFTGSRPAPMATPS